MGNICVIILEGVCAEEPGQQWQLASFIDEGTEGWSSARVEEERVEQSDWIVNG